MKFFLAPPVRPYFRQTDRPRPRRAAGAFCPILPRARARASVLRRGRLHF